MTAIKLIIAVVLLGVCLGVAELIAYGTKILIMGVISKRRKGKNNRRIIRQAKAAGVWDKPEVLGGKALELKAWQQYGIKREPGETDACLRRRVMNAIENEYANAPKWGG